MAEPGYKGKIVMGAATVGGMFTWNYDGETRKTEEVPEFGSQVVHDEPTVIVGGTVTANGNVKIGDTGVAAVQAAFDAATKIAPDAIKFFINDTKYMTPKTGSTVIVTKCNAINHDASGICKVEMAFKVDGQMEEKTAA